jgi:malonyl CoA-acyl carrier protein transacylase
MPARIIELADNNEEFITDVDGFVKWWPKTQGCLTEHELRALADEMERRNAVWTAQINAYFDKQESA